MRPKSLSDPIADSCPDPKAAWSLGRGPHGGVWLLKQRLGKAGLCTVEVVGMLLWGCSHRDALRPIPRLHNQKPQHSPSSALSPAVQTIHCNSDFPTPFQPCCTPGCYCRQLRFPGNSTCPGCADTLWDPRADRQCVWGHQLSPPPKSPLDSRLAEGKRSARQCELQGRSQAVSKGSVDIVVTTGVKLV